RARRRNLQPRRTRAVRAPGCAGHNWHGAGRFLTRRDICVRLQRTRRSPSRRSRAPLLCLKRSFTPCPPHPYMSSSSLRPLRPLRLCVTSSLFLFLFSTLPQTPVVGGSQINLSCCSPSI